MLTPEGVGIILNHSNHGNSTKDILSMTDKPTICEPSELEVPSSDVRAQRAAANDPRFCPACGNRGRRISYRREVNGYHRRYQCPGCEWRWTTIEIDLSRAQSVIRMERAFVQIYRDIRREHPGMMIKEVEELPEIELMDTRSAIPDRGEFEHDDDGYNDDQ